MLYKAAAEWAKVELPVDFAVDLNDDFGAGFRGSEDMPHLITMRQAGELSRETFLRETKRRSIISDEVDIEAEMDRIEGEGPGIGTLPSFIQPNAPEDKTDDDDEEPTTTTEPEDDQTEDESPNPFTGP
jgi:hypothetical protein